MDIELEKISTLRRAILDQGVEVPDTHTFRRLLHSMFPYAGMLKEKQMQKAKEILKEDLESLLTVAPILQTRKRKRSGR